MELAKYEELKQVIYLCSFVSRKSSDLNCFDLAFNYAFQSFNLLQKLSAYTSLAQLWSTEYDFVLNIYRNLAELAFIKNEIQLANQTIQQALLYITSIRDHCLLYEIRMEVEICNGNIYSAIKTGISTLELLSVTLSQFNHSHYLKFSALAFKERLINNSIITNRTEIFVQSYLHKLIIPSLLTPKFFWIIALTSLDRLLELGPSLYSALFLCNFIMGLIHKLILCNAQFNGMKLSLNEKKLR